MRFSEQLWKSEWFVAECANVQRWSELPTPRAKLAAQFGRIPDEDLRVLAFDVLLR